MQDLSESAPAVWRRLSVFSGSCSREALEAVAAGEDLAPGDISALLAQLASQGLILVEQSDHEVRYRLPAALHPEAWTQLNDSGEVETVYQRLVSFYVTLAQRVLGEAFGPQRSVWMQRLEQEQVNLHALLDWLVKQGDAERGLELAFLLQELWFEEPHTSEGREWFARLLALPHAAAPNSLRAQALDLAGALALNQGDYTVAHSLKEEGLTILRQLGEPVSIGYALLHLGHLVGLAHGDFTTAQARYQEALEHLRRADHAEGITHALACLGSIAILQGDYATACPLIEESLRRYWELGADYDLAVSLWRVAGVAAGLGHPEQALRLAGASAVQMAAIGVSQPPAFQERYEQMLEPARAVLNEAAQTALWEEGQAMTLEQTIVYALEELAALAP